MNFQIIPKKGREESEGTKIHGGNMDSLSFGAKKKNEEGNRKIFK